MKTMAEAAKRGDTMEEKHAMHNQHEQERDPAHAGHGADHSTHAEHERSAPPDEHAGHDAMRSDQMERADHGSAHSGHGVDHTGHENMFRKRFWANLILTVPVLLFSPMLQEWFGFSMPEFPGSRWIGPLFAIVIFFYGGLPFLQMAVPEIRTRKPGMMTLISLAISVAFVYSLFALFVSPGSGFFW
jgi:Cu2+-exporting ATPase